MNDDCCLNSSERFSIYYDEHVTIQGLDACFELENRTTFKLYTAMSLR